MFKPVCRTEKVGENNFLGNELTWGYLEMTVKHFVFTSICLPISTSLVLIRHLYLVQIETCCYRLGEVRISIIKSRRQEGHPANGNTPTCRITRCRLLSGNCPTLRQCGVDGVVFFRLHSRDVKR